MCEECTVSGDVKPAGWDVNVHGVFYAGDAKEALLTERPKYLQPQTDCVMQERVCKVGSQKPRHLERKRGLVLPGSR